MSSDKKKLATGSLLRVGQRVAHVLVAIFLTPFIIHSLGTEDFGLWTLAGVFLGYYGMMDMGVGAAVCRYVSTALGKKDEEEANAYLSTAMGLYIVIGLVLFVLTLVLSGLAWHFDYHGRGRTFAQIILMIGGLQAIGMPMQVFGGALVARLRYDLLTSFDFITLTLRTVLLIIVLNLGYGILGMAYVSLACGILSHSMPYITVRKVMPFVKIRWALVSRKVGRTLLGFSAFTSISRIASIVRFRIDVVVVSEFISLIATAYYQVAAMLIQQFRFGMQAIFGVLFPYFGKLSGDEENRDKMRLVFFFMMRRAIQATLFAATAMIIWGHNFIEIWVGEEFTVAYPCVVALAVAEIVTGCQVPAYHLLGGMARHKFIALINASEAVCNLILSISLVAFTDLGILGVALGTAIPMVLFQGIGVPIYFSRQMKVPLGRYFWIWGENLLICLTILSPSILYAYFYSRPTIVSLALQFAVALPVYVLGLWLFERSRMSPQAKPMGLIKWAISLPKEI